MRFDLALILPVVAAVGVLLATTRKAYADVPDVTNSLADIFPSLRSEGMEQVSSQVLVDRSAASPRGIRNNNPGNLIITTIAWKGKIPPTQNTDGKYEQFESARYGIRAMFMDMRGDIEKDGLNTIRKLITEYAPMFENNTGAYINAVSQKLGLHADAPLKPEHYLALVKAVIHHENGQQPYSDSLIKESMAMA